MTPKIYIILQLLMDLKYGRPSSVLPCSHYLELHKMRHNLSQRDRTMSFEIAYPNHGALFAIRASPISH